MDRIFLIEILIKIWFYCKLYFWVNLDTNLFYIFSYFQDVKNLLFIPYWHNQFTSLRIHRFIFFDCALVMIYTRKAAYFI